MPGGKKAITREETRARVAAMTPEHLERRNRLTEENIGLVYYYAKKIHRRFDSNAAFSVDELATEGWISLLDAATNFDPAKGRFAALACSAIPRGMLLYIRRNHSRHHFRIVSQIEELPPDWAGSRDAEHGDVRDAATDVELLLGELPERAATLLRRRFGIGCERVTGVQVGKEWGVGGAMISVRYHQGLNMLRQVAEQPRFAAMREAYTA